MKKMLLFLLLALPPCSMAQNVPDVFIPVASEMSPKVYGDFDFSPAAVKRFEESEDREFYNDIYDVVEGGCSFYCGCQIGEITASSTLPDQGSHSYAPSKIHDLTYSTAWVEGKDDYGIGEWIEYRLPPENPRITTMYVANGIVRNKKVWRANSRVKTLEVTVNGKPFTTFNLKDVYALQGFDVGEIGYPDRDSDLKGREPIVIRFTIRDVYPGRKFKDTAITEIFFHGIDVH